MEFEYDPQKSEANLIKHGIDFEESKYLWDDPNRLQLQARSETELRYALIALYGDKLWSAFYTIRDEKVRIISVRRARKGEGRLYYES
jgi:uncharacterized protein